MLWVVLAGMTGLAARAALWPLVFGRRGAAGPSSDAAFHKVRPSKIERDVAGGQLPAEEAASALASARKGLAGDAAAGQGLDALARELGIGG